MAKKNILVGGEAGFVSTLQEFFSNSEKFGVMVADDGDAMIAMLEENPDLAIIDIDLPGRRGDDCCRIVKQSCLSPATLIALAVSGEKRQDIWRCIDAGCDVILPKPLQYERLAEVVTESLFREGRNIPRRFPVRLKVRYGMRPDGLTETSSVNLTTVGMFVETEDILAVGTPLHLVFTLPHGGGRIECTARVAWLNDRKSESASLLRSGLGLEFDQIDDDDVNQIQEFLYSMAET